MLTWSVPAATVIVNDWLEVSCPELESVAVAVKRYEPGWVGVPEIVPELVDVPVNCNPGGSEPLDTFHRIGSVPPLVWSVAV